MEHWTKPPFGRWRAFVFMGLLLSLGAVSKGQEKHESHKQYILAHYSEQLSSPEAKKRKSFAQFGYGLSFFPFPLFPITGFIDPDDFGQHSYGKPGIKEKNGALYTCRGGFIDFSHLRVALDWTVYLSFQIICEGTDMDLPSHDGKLRLLLRDARRLPLEDMVSLSQRVAFERLVWHELCSWYYHLPNYTFDERQSTFTPEDTYSNFLGTCIGRDVVLRILNEREGLPFEQVASEEIRKHIDRLGPVATKQQSMDAYDLVDAYKQAKLPESERNADVWWDSRVVFTDERYVFKRYTYIGPDLAPWLVPKSRTVGCTDVKAEVLTVPQKTRAGVSLYRYYTLRITPDSSLFYNKRTHEQLHKPFAPFESRDMQKIIDHVSRDMQKELLPGFSRRNRTDPEKHYDNLRKVWFK